MNPAVVKLNRYIGIGLMTFGAIALLIGLLPASAFPIGVLKDLRFVFAVGGGGFIVFGLFVWATAKIKPPTIADRHKTRIDALEARIAHLEGKTIKPPKS